MNYGISIIIVQRKGGHGEMGTADIRWRRKTPLKTDLYHAEFGCDCVHTPALCTPCARGRKLEGEERVVQT